MSVHALPPALEQPPVIRRVYPDLARRLDGGHLIKAARTRYAREHACSPAVARWRYRLGRSWSGCQGIARFARKEIGTPYVWGGSAPGGFDCSGLVVWAGRQIGLRLPHYTGALLRTGKAISTGNRRAWRPGDLVFPHSGHVRIYLGRGRSVEAPHSGAVVRVVPSDSSPLAVRRVV